MEYIIWESDLETKLQRNHKKIALNQLNILLFPSPTQLTNRKMCFSQHPQNDNKNIRAPFQKYAPKKVKVVSLRINHKYYTASHHMVKSEET